MPPIEVVKVSRMIESKFLATSLAAQAPIAFRVQIVDANVERLVARGAGNRMACHVRPNVRIQPRAFCVGCNARLGLAYGSSIESPNPANTYFPANASLKPRNAGSPVQCPGAMCSTFHFSRNALVMR